LPRLRLARLQVRRLRWLRRLLPTLGTVPMVLSSRAGRLLDHRADHHANPALGGMTVCGFLQ
jgi:hypothetical protein